MSNVRSALYGVRYAPDVPSSLSLIAPDRNSLPGSSGPSAKPPMCPRSSSISALASRASANASAASPLPLLPLPPKRINIAMVKITIPANKPELELVKPFIVALS